MKDSNSTLGQIMRAAGWNAAGFRSYLLLQKDEEAFVSSLIRALDSPDSDNDSEISLGYYIFFLSHSGG